MSDLCAHAPAMVITGEGPGCLVHPPQVLARMPTRIDHHGGVGLPGGRPLVQREGDDGLCPKHGPATNAQGGNPPAPNPYTVIAIPR